MGPSEIGALIPIVALIVGGAVALALIARNSALRLSDSKGASTGFARDVMAKLDRMEQSMDAIALEVERISEGQRYTTRLLAERATGPNGGAESRDNRAQ